MSGGDSDLLRGIHELVNPQNVKVGVNYAKIEESLLSSGTVQDEKDPTTEFRRELSELANSLGVSMESPKKSASPMSSQRTAYGGSPLGYSPATGRSPLGYTPSTARSPYAGSPLGASNATPIQMSPRQSTPVSGELNLPQGFLDSLGDSPNGMSTPQEIFPGFNYNNESTPMADSPHLDDSFNFGNSELGKRTEEEHRHDQVRTVMESIGGADSQFISMEEATKEDEKITMLEQIDSLRLALEEENSQGVERIPKVTNENSYADIENVLRRLRLKNDRARYTGLADEFVLWGAQGMEELFDGKRRWFGKNPDLTGWSKEVQVKLRRMRHDTSTLVSGVMHDYNIGPGMRILLELLPNMFMYARRRKQNYGKDSIYSDADIARHMTSIRNVTES